MCGIFALFAPATEMAERSILLERALQTMRFRGPDGSGRHLSGPVAIGMTRLAIIDVAGSPQPLFNETGELALVCNGEIYNYRELRAQLSSLGHRFRTEGDCETILHLYEEYGLEGLQRLRGMFGFALWDSRVGRLVVARDRLGIKPLYWAKQGDSVAFSSELRGLVATGFARVRLAREPTLGLLKHTYAVHAEESLLEGVSRLAPGHFVCVDKSGITVQPYWREPTPGGGGSSEAVLEQLVEAARLHLRSDVPSAVLLSGGIDSSFVAARAMLDGGDAIVITAGYDRVSAEDESTAAMEYARRLGLSVHRLAVSDADLESGFADMTARVDEPAADPSSVIQWLLYRRARELGCRVVHTGIGGDEVFFGYGAYNKIGRALDLERRFLPAGVAGASSLLRAFAHPAGDDSRSDDDLLGVTPAVFSRMRILRRLAPVGSAALSSPGSARHWRSSDDVYKALRGTYLLNNGLLLGDKVGMAASMEVRVPLVDHCVLEAVLGLPVWERVPGRGPSKPVLRKALDATGYPLPVVKKKGFEIPAHLLSTLVGKHLEMLRESPTARKFFSPEAWQSLLSRHAKDNLTRTGRSADRYLRRAWLLGLAPEPDRWSVTTLLFTVLCVDRAREYWASPVNVMY